MDNPTEPTEPTDKTSSRATPPPTRSAPRRFRIGRLALKELRETLRDRRTIITLILMPLLVYPILSLVFRTFLTNNASLFSTDNKPVVLRIVYGSDDGIKDADQILGRIGSVITRIEDDARGSAGAPARISSQGTSIGNASSIGNTNENTDENTDESEPGQAAEGLSSDQKSSRPRMGILSGSGQGFPGFVRFKAHRWVFPLEDDDRSLAQVVKDGDADVGVLLESLGGKSIKLGNATVFSRNDPASATAAAYLKQNFDAFNEKMREELMRRAGLPSEPVLSVIDSRIDQEAGGDAEQASVGGFSLASLIPLILVLMTITGAVYPAIDLTAGEKERGTLETLMAAPIPRIGILFSKFTAVLTVAVLTALLNMIGMAATIWAFRLDQFLAGSGEFTLLIAFKVFLLLILFAAFYSALLLAVTSYARSFKEAQAYLIPIILLSMGPGLLAMTPGLTLNGPWAVTPMINILLLARDVIQNQIQVVPACIAVFSTLLYGVFALLMASRSFGSDAILYSSHGSFSEMFARPRKTQWFVPSAAAVFCVTLLFPINFVLIGFLGRLPSETAGDLAMRFSIMGVFTLLSFMVFPWLVARHQKTNTASGFGLFQPRVVFYLAAILLGVSLWPIVMSLISGWHDLYSYFAGAEAGSAWHDRLVEETTKQVARVRMVSPVIIALCLSIIPAVAEEWFFRGMLLRSLLQTKKAWMAILISATVFGLFHVLGNSVVALDRLIPTTLVGVVLGYIAYKSDSIYPGMILHSIHNAMVSFLAYYQPLLSKMSWFPGEDEAIPNSWVGIAAIGVFVGMALVIGSKRTPADRPETETDSSSATTV